MLKKLSYYAKNSGPGWLQAAVTLGGGSLAGALYLGVVGGDGLLWLQPIAMIFGVIMLSALAYVTLSTEDTPFVSVCKHISPVLAWGWLIATVIADCVFCPAQTSLGLGIVQQNFGLSKVNPYLISIPMAAVAFSVIFLYLKGNKGVARFENILKVMVGIVILCFFGAAITHLVNGNASIGSILKGFIPNPSTLFNPAASLNESIAATGDAADWWSAKTANSQRGVIIAAFGTAVAINMTFLLPYTLRKKGWGKNERELSRYDLALGLAVPFIIATAFLVITSSSQFHDQHADILDPDSGKPIALQDGYYKILSERLALDGDVPKDQAAMRAAADALPIADRELAASLTKRDAGQLATALSPLVGKQAAQLIFGIGILAMAISTMIVHMLMNGFAISQAVGRPGAKVPFLIGAAMPALTACAAPFLWNGSNKAAMAVPASVIATTLLPIAYLTFILLMNSKKTLGKEKLTGSKLTIVNVLMGIGFLLASFASIWALMHKGQPGQIGMA
ncbi:MAG: divalent metal cation transporter, partial [Akkermansiaceae bacterium]